MEQALNFRVGHGGVDRAMHKLGLMGRSWPYMRNHVRLFVWYCPCCQKMSAVRIPINVHKFTTAGEILFDVLNIDFIGPFPTAQTCLSSWTHFQDGQSCSTARTVRRSQHAAVF